VLVERVRLARRVQTDEQVVSGVVRKGVIEAGMPGEEPGTLDETPP
jgi:hypothetical protein